MLYIIPAVKLNQNKKKICTLSYFLPEIYFSHGSAGEVYAENISPDDTRCTTFLEITSIYIYIYIHFSCLQ